MNYLAHLFLSGDNEEVMIGNLMEDYVVGRLDHPRNLDIAPTIKVGIQLHRLIDTFTDTHNSISNCKSTLYHKHHKFSSLIIDVFFDHFLAIYWEEYSTENFVDFRKRVYRNFETYYSVLPEKMKPLIDSMISHDWLKNYSEFWGIERALYNISRRTTRVNQLTTAVDDLKENYAVFDESFKVFFPLLIKECREMIENQGFTFSTLTNK